MADRMREYKNRGRDAAEARNRRRENTVELRRNKKTEQLMKRRNVAAEDGSDKAVVALGQSQLQNIPASASTTVTDADIPLISQQIRSPDPSVQFDMTQKARCDRPPATAALPCCPRLALRPPTGTPPPAAHPLPPTLHHPQEAAVQVEEPAAGRRHPRRPRARLCRVSAAPRVPRAAV